MNISSFSLVKQSLAMAQLAKAAYSRNGRLTFAHWGFTHDYKILNHRFSWVHVAANDRAVVLSFKGTSIKSLNDFLADADVWPNMDGHSWVHRGFKRRSEWILPQVINYLKNHPGKEIWITGHSMGGAIGLHIACELESIGIGPVKIFTFGSPRVGNRDYVKLIKSTHHRFVNCNDLVPKMPISWIGYRHHGNLYYLNFYGELRDFNAWQRFKDRFRSKIHALKRGKLFDSFNDHKIGSYVKKLSNLDVNSLPNKDQLL